MMAASKPNCNACLETSQPDAEDTADISPSIMLLNLNRPLLHEITAPQSVEHESVVPQSGHPYKIENCLGTCQPNKDAATETSPNAHTESSLTQPINLTQPEKSPQETTTPSSDNDIRVVCQSGLPEDIHAASVHVCEVMDKLGYNEVMVRHRKEAHRKNDVLLNMQRKDVIRTTTGSKGEGLSALYESDTDYVHLGKDVLCILPENTHLQLPPTHTVLTMDGEHSPTGHFWLKLKHIMRTKENNIINDILAASIVHNNRQTYISSQKLTELLKSNQHTQLEFGRALTLSGPAVTETSKISSWDSVFALPCQHQMPAEWISRPRYHNWPSPKLIQEISDTPAYLVPVGCKSSKNKHIEWRLCFTGEQKLIDSFTECQYKLYIVLKFLIKTELKPICLEMSSYILKNIVFWFIESNLQELFSKENLLRCLRSCLQMLQQAIRDNHLSYYMIPGRNLLTGRINHSQQQQLVSKLDELIQEGPRVILRCPKVCAALHMSPTELEEKGWWRDELEKLCLEMHNTRLAQWKHGMEVDEMFDLASLDPHFQNVMMRMYDMVYPLWRLYQFDGGIMAVLDQKVTDALS